MYLKIKVIILKREIIFNINIFKTRNINLTAPRRHGRGQHKTGHNNHWKGSERSVKTHTNIIIITSVTFAVYRKYCDGPYISIELHEWFRSDVIQPRSRFIINIIIERLTWHDGLKLGWKVVWTTHYVTPFSTGARSDLQRLWKSFSQWRTTRSSSSYLHSESLDICSCPVVIRLFSRRRSFVGPNLAAMPFGEYHEARRMKNEHKSSSTTCLNNFTEFTTKKNYRTQPKHVLTVRTFLWLKLRDTKILQDGKIDFRTREEPLK